MKSSGQASRNHADLPKSHKTPAAETAGATTAGATTTRATTAGATTTRATTAGATTTRATTTGATTAGATETGLLYADGRVIAGEGIRIGFTVDQYRDLHLGA
ncbi:MAG: hypothetical protein ABSG03_23690, partial [Bryobacteraceae bacterium]